MSAESKGLVRTKTSLTVDNTCVITRDFCCGRRSAIHGNLICFILAVPVVAIWCQRIAQRGEYHIRCSQPAGTAVVVALAVAFNAISSASFSQCQWSPSAVSVPLRTLKHTLLAASRHCCRSGIDSRCRRVGMVMVMVVVVDLCHCRVSSRSSLLSLMVVVMLLLALNGVTVPVVAVGNTSCPVGRGWAQRTRVLSAKALGRKVGSRGDGPTRH
jgi:hypothetical protein